MLWRLQGSRPLWVDGLLWCLVMTALSMPVTSDSVPCPLACSCDNTLVTCSDPALTEIPHIPTTTETLVITGTQLQAMPSNAFANLTALRVLKIEGNARLSHVSTGAFAGLGQLLNLSLAGNQLSAGSLEGGMETFRPLRESLKALDLSGNQFRLVPHTQLQLLQGVTVLNVSRNALHSAVLGSGVRSMDSLEVIDISGNDLGSLDKDAFQELASHRSELEKSIYVSRCNLREIASGTFDNLPMIAHLDLSGNRELSHATISTVMADLANSLHLSSLSLADVNLTQVGDLFRPLQPTYVKSLDLSRNQLDSIEPNALSYLGSLTDLNLSGNRLRSLRPGIFNRLSSLTTLNVDDNELEGWSSQALESVENLVTLSARGNRFTAFDPAPFDKLYALEMVALDRNAIAQIASGLDSIQRLKRLSLAGNQLTSIGELTQLLQLEWLDVSGNRLTRLAENTLPQRSKLTHFNASHNAITEIHARAFANRSPDTIDLSYNQVALLPNNGWYKTVTLSLAHNQVEYIPRGAFKDTFLLRQLDLSGNVLEKLSADMFTDMAYSLQELSLSGNLLSSWVANTVSPFATKSPVGTQGGEGTPGSPTSAGASSSFAFGLTHLDLSANGIGELADGFFRNLTNLRSLDLSDNALTSVGPLAFRGLVRLEHLNLARNHLATLNPRAFSITVTPRLATVDGRANRFECDCSLLPFVEWHSSSNTAPRLTGWSDKGAYTCASPPSRHLLDLNAVTLSGDNCGDSASERTIILIVIACTAFVVLLAASALFWQHRCRVKRKLKKERYRAIFEASPNQGAGGRSGDRDCGVEQSEVYLHRPGGGVSGPQQQCHYQVPNAGGGSPHLSGSSGTPRSSQRDKLLAGSNSTGGTVIEMSPQSSRRQYSVDHSQATSSVATTYAAPDSQYSGGSDPAGRLPVAYHFEAPPPPPLSNPPLSSARYEGHSYLGGGGGPKFLPGVGVPHPGVAYVPTGVSSGGSSIVGGGCSSSQSRGSEYSSPEYGHAHGQDFV